MNVFFFVQCWLTLIIELGSPFIAYTALPLQTFNNRFYNYSKVAATCNSQLLYMLYILDWNVQLLQSTITTIKLLLIYSF